MPIRARMALLGVGVIAATLLLFSVLLYALATRNVPREQDAALRRRAEQAAAFVAAAPAEELRPHRVPAAADLRESRDVFVAVLDGAGEPITSTGELDGAAPRFPVALRAAAGDGGAPATVTLVPGERFRVQFVPWERPDLGLRGYALAGQSLRHNRNQVGALLVFLAIAWAVSMAVAAVAIWIVVGRALRPLKAVAHAADEIARTRDPSRRLPPVRARDETRLLTESFNGMLGRLEEAIEAQRRFVADASHELRTPLTTIRTNAAYLQRPDIPEDERAAAVRDIADESERMARLAQDLLTLARADAGRPLERAPVDLAAIAAAVCRRARVLYPDRPIETAGDDAIPLCANEDALGRLLWILVDNAIKHTAAEGRIRIWAARDGDSVELKVIDDGRGIPPGEAERIFERFYRVDAARGDGGAGLGLAIARWIATAHGGAIRAYTNEWGGATFAVELPAVASATCHDRSSPSHD